MAIYNIGLGSVVGGFGAVINKDSDEKFGKVFLKGFWQGAIGGYIVYESKNFMLNVANEDKLEYAWGAKVINAVGISMIENASLNKDFWSKWHLHIGFNRLELEIDRGAKLNYKIMPTAFILTTLYGVGNKFEWALSLRTGEIIFSNSDVNNVHAGATWGKVIILSERGLTSYRLIAHEIIHSYQYDDFNFVNTFLNRPWEKLISKNKFLTNINKYIYYDLQAPVFGGLYLLENSNRNTYYDNFFEREAGIFSNSIN